MKVTKTISLDQETARIAGRMNNFSRFVRVAIHAWAMGDDIEEALRRQRLWKRVTDHLLAVIEHESERDQEQMQDLLMDAMASARNQEEFDIQRS